MTSEQFISACLNAAPGVRAKIEMILNGDDTITQQPIGDARTCSQAEASRRLRVSRPTVNRWMRAGILKSVNMAGVPRILLTSIDAVACGRVPAQAMDGATDGREKEIAARRAEAGRKGAAARAARIKGAV